MPHMPLFFAFGGRAHQGMPLKPVILWVFLLAGKSSEGLLQPGFCCSREMAHQKLSSPLYLGREWPFSMFCTLSSWTLQLLPSLLMSPSRGHISPAALSTRKIFLLGYVWVWTRKILSVALPAVTLTAIVTFLFLIRPFHLGVVQFFDLANSVMGPCAPK